MTDAEQVACDALRSAGLDELADNLEWAKAAVIKKLNDDAMKAADEKASAERRRTATAMREAMDEELFSTRVHQSGDVVTLTLCGGRMPRNTNLMLKSRVTCLACLHILFGPGTSGR